MFGYMICPLQYKQINSKILEKLKKLNTGITASRSHLEEDPEHDEGCDEDGPEDEDEDEGDITAGGGQGVRGPAQSSAPSPRSDVRVAV